MLAILNALPSSVLRFLAAALHDLRPLLDNRHTGRRLAEVRIAIWIVLSDRAHHEAEVRRAERLAELHTLAREVPEYHGWSCAVGEA